MSGVLVTLAAALSLVAAPRPTPPPLALGPRPQSEPNVNAPVLVAQSADAGSEIRRHLDRRRRLDDYETRLERANERVREWALREAASRDLGAPLEQTQTTRRIRRDLDRRLERQRFTALLMRAVDRSPGVVAPQHLRWEIRSYEREARFRDRIRQRNRTLRNGALGPQVRSDSSTSPLPPFRPRVGASPGRLR